MTGNCCDDDGDNTTCNGPSKCNKQLDEDEDDAVDANNSDEGKDFSTTANGGSNHRDFDGERMPSTMMGPMGGKYDFGLATKEHHMYNSNKQQW